MSRLLVLIILLGLIPVSAFAEDSPVYIFSIDGQGTAVDPLYPTDVATAPSGDVYVVDDVQNRVVRFGSDGSLIGAWYSYGSGTPFNNPQGIALDDHGRVYVADTDNSRVVVLDGEGNYLNSWAVDFPWGITVGSGSYESVYVTSTVNGSGDEYVFRYSMEGALQGYWGGARGSGSGHFNWARDVEIDSRGRVYVADLGNYRIQYFDNAGTYLGEFGNSPSSGFERPRALGIDARDNVFVYDEYASNLLKFSSDLDLLSIWGTYSQGTGLDVMGLGSIHVCGDDWNEVRIYGYPPVIISAQDIPGDQGRWLRLQWQASVLDQAVIPPMVSGYGVYRRQPDAAKALVHGDLPADKAGSGMLEAMAAGMEDWDVLGYVPARHDGSYSFVAPTLVDSTASGGIDWSVFVVTAFCSDGTFFDSAPDSGYSVDNIAPPVPGAPVVTENLGDLELEVSWQASAAPDFDHFGVYRGATADFMPASPDDAFAVTSGTVYLDDTVLPGDYWYYRVGSFDDAGLFSGYSPAAGSAVVTAAPQAPQARTRLFQNVPNPFNPVTTIAYELAFAGRVDLRIFDVSGHLVRILEAGTSMAAGPHEAVWNGLDDQGGQAASGLYFYRFETGGKGLTRRMVLMK